MYRLLIRGLTMYLNQNNFGKRMNYLTRISSSYFCLKQSHRSLNTDDLRNIPSYYASEQMKKLSKGRFVNFLKKKLNCSSELATDICFIYPEFTERTLQEVSMNMDLLILKGVPQSLILDNPWLLTLSPVHLISNISALEEMKPENIVDFVPLLIASSEQLTKIKIIAQKEEETIPYRHRIYYLSNLLNMKPYIISQYVSHQLFVLEIPFNDLDDRTKTLLEYMQPKNIINSLKIVNSIKISNETKTILGGRSLAQYYADRLKIDIQTVETMLEHCPALLKLGLIYVEEKLDYLLNDAGVTGLDIARYPFILKRSLTTIRERLQELQAYDCRYKLSKVCQSAKTYNNYINNLKKRQEK